MKEHLCGRYEQDAMKSGFRQMLLVSNSAMTMLHQQAVLECPALRVSTALIRILIREELWMRVVESSCQAMMELRWGRRTQVCWVTTSLHQ
jgi:hypothetical protein